MDIKNENLVLSVTEAGRILRLGRAAAYRHARAGKIPVLKFGRTLRVPRAALMRMIENVGSDNAANQGDS